jgi:Putative transmembrane protein (PGPGW)
MKPLAREVWKQAWRVGIAITGGAVVLAGVAMLVLPGPGFLAIAAGLALLALEFDAARELRDRLIRWLRARGRRRRA